MKSYAFASIAVVSTAAGSALAADQVPITLNYNFNGMVHSGEAGWADNPDGFRSIADRALRADGDPGSFTAGAIVGSTGLNYLVVGSPLSLDIVHLGNRQIFNAYDLVEDADNIGIQPSWDTSPDHTGPQVSDVSGLGIEMFGNTQIGVLYQISNGGGQFDMTLTFSDATSVTVRLSGPDWYGTPAVPAPLAGVLSQTRLGGASQRWNATNSIDSGLSAPAAENLSLIEGIVSVQDLINDGFGDVTGKTLSSITFGNASYPVGNFDRGYAIVAATARGASNYGPIGTGSVTPNPVVSGQNATFSVAVTLGSGSPNNIASVIVDGTTLDLGPIALNDSGINGDVTAGDNNWGVTVAVPGTALAGPRNLPYQIVDAQARTFDGTIGFNVLGPPNAIDLGTLSQGITSVQAELVSGGVVWYRFDLAQSVDAVDLEFLNIDTEGSVITGNDTEIGLYSATGSFIITDDDDGTDFLSQLTYGSTVALSAPGNGQPYNGRDGATFAAGTYYLAVTGYNSTFNPTSWNVSSPHTRTGTLNTNISLGTTPPGGLPSEFTDLGVLADETPVTSTQQLDAGEVRWFRFELATAIDGSAIVRQYLDIDTEGSSVGNTIICLFRDDGNGSVVNIDNDDGSGQLSQLTYGRGTRAAVGDGLTYNGRDAATLTTGVYYIAVTEAPASFGANFRVALNGGVSNGPVTVNVRRGVQTAVIAGPIHNPANGSDYYLLERGFTFPQAESFAVGLGGHLASIQDADENEFVRGSVLGFDGTDRRGWIGFTDEAVEGTFAWTDGSPVVYTNWNGGEPNNGGGGEDYAEMLGSNGQWNDLAAAGVSGGGDWAVVEVPGGGPMFCDADWCQDGSVGVPDIFCFLSAWFAMDPDARNYGGTPGVPAIFAFLSEWFGTGQGPCTP